jgi:predicted AAA+ superfamily ATPase
MEDDFKILKKYNYWNNEKIDPGFFRKSYVEKISHYLDNRLVKVILGQRRVGKSYLMRMIIGYLIEKGSVPRKNILYINKDIAELNFIDSSEILIQVINNYRSTLKPEGKVYIFLDEVQEIGNWEKAVNSLSQDYTFAYELFITGSNANLLSTELSTYLSGRYICFEVLPFSFGEYIDFNNLEKNKNSFIAYLKNGGLPESLRLKNPEMKRNYFMSLKDSIVLKDIVRRHNVRDIYLLDKIINFLIDSIGGLFSLNSVVNYLKSSGYKTNVETVGNYINYLRESYFIYEVDRYDIQGKRILGSEKKYIQVCYLLADEAVVEREFGNLARIDDHYEKLVISLDDVNMGNRAGIAHINAWDFIT